MKLQHVRIARGRRDNVPQSLGLVSFVTSANRWWVNGRSTNISQVILLISNITLPCSVRAAHVQRWIVNKPNPIVISVMCYYYYYYYLSTSPVTDSTAGEVPSNFYTAGGEGKHEYLSLFFRQHITRCRGANKILKTLFFLRHK